MLFPLIFTLLIIPSWQICYAPDCPYGCCLDETQCNLNPNCERELGDTCFSQDDCTTGCCVGNTCVASSECDKAGVIVGVILGVLFFIVAVIASIYIYIRIQRQRKIEQNTRDVMGFVRNQYLGQPDVTTAGVNAGAAAFVKKKYKTHTEKPLPPSVQMAMGKLLIDQLLKQEPNHKLKTDQGKEIENFNDILQSPDFNTQGDQRSNAV